MSDIFHPDNVDTFWRYHCIHETVFMHRVEFGRIRIVYENPEI